MVGALLRYGCIALGSGLIACSALAEDDIDLNPDFDETLIRDSIMFLNISVGTSHRQIRTRLRGHGSPAAARFLPPNPPPGPIDPARGLGARPELIPRGYENGSILCLSDGGGGLQVGGGLQGGGGDGLNQQEDSCVLTGVGGRPVNGGTGLQFIQHGRATSVQTPPPPDFGFGPGSANRDLGSVESDEFTEEITFEFGPINLFLRPFGLPKDSIHIYLMGRISRSTFEEAIRATTFYQQFTVRRLELRDTFPIDEFGDFTGGPPTREIVTVSQDVITEYNQLTQDTDFESYIFTLGPSLHYDPEWIDGLYLIFECYFGLGRAEAETRVTDVLYRDVNGSRSEIGRVQFNEQDSDWGYLFGFNIHSRLQFSRVFIGIFTGWEYMESLYVNVGTFESEFSQDSWRNGAYIGWGI